MTIKKLFGKRIHIKALVNDTPKIGAIWIPPTVARTTEIAKVLAVGDEISGVSPGDYIVYDRYNGSLLSRTERILTEAGFLGTVIL